jgi:hypothetical protein
VRWLPVGSKELATWAVPTGNAMARPRRWYEDTPDTSVDKEEQWVSVIEWFDEVEKLFIVATATDSDVELRHAERLEVTRVVPVVLLCEADRPMVGLIPGLSQYTAAACRAVLDTIGMNRAVRYSAHKALVREAAIPNEDDRDRLFDDEDGSVIRVQGNGDLDNIVKWVERPSSDPLLRDAIARADTTSRETRGAPFTMGQQTKYASATEIGQLADYAQTQDGLLLERIDAALAALVGRWLRMADASHRFVFRSGPDVHVILPADLEVAWTVTVRDASGTPAQRQQERRNLSEGQALLTPLLQLYSTASDPVIKAYAREAASEVRLRWDLPESLSIDALVSRVEQDAKPPAADVLSTAEAGSTGASDAPSLPPPPGVQNA